MLERVPLGFFFPLCRRVHTGYETRDLPVKIWISTFISHVYLCPLPVEEQQLHVSDESKTRYYFRTANIP